MKIYVDFDGVIFDSEKILFEEYHKLKEKNEEIKMNFIKTMDWEYILKRSMIINDAIDILKKYYSKDIAILTKVHSLDNEGTAKIKKLRSLGVLNDVILSPFPLKKCEVVNAKGNILIDDTVHNLDDWQNSDGLPIYFNKDNKDIDGWNNRNTEYKRIRKLDEVFKNY